MNWRRGLLRAWVVIALAWVGLVGWHEYAAKPWNWDWGLTRSGECWDRFAKWPDGKPFQEVGH